MSADMTNGLLDLDGTKSPTSWSCKLKGKVIFCFLFFMDKTLNIIKFPKCNWKLVVLKVLS